MHCTVNTAHCTQCAVCTAHCVIVPNVYCSLYTVCTSPCVIAHNVYNSLCSELTPRQGREGLGASGNKADAFLLPFSIILILAIIGQWPVTIIIIVFYCHSSSAIVRLPFSIILILAIIVAGHHHNHCNAMHCITLHCIVKKSLLLQFSIILVALVAIIIVTMKIIVKKSFGLIAVCHFL